MCYPLPEKSLNLILYDRLWGIMGYKFSIMPFFSCIFQDLKVIDLQQHDYMRVLETAVQFGLPVLLQNVHEKLDPSLDPILNKSIVKIGQLFFQCVTSFNMLNSDIYIVLMYILIEKIQASLILFIKIQLHVWNIWHDRGLFNKCP